MVLATITSGSYASAVMAEELAPNTRVAYGKAWANFTRWCDGRHLVPFDATDEDVSTWMVSLAKDGLHPGTVSIYKSGVNKAFELQGLRSPCKTPLIKATMRIVRRDYRQPSHAVAALVDWQVAKMIQRCPPTTIGRRDAAVLSVGFACALRRSELTALTVEDVRFLDDDLDRFSRMMVTVRQSKTDQQGVGQVIPVINGVNIVPILHLKRWLEISGIESGLIFRTLKRGGKVTDRGLHTSDVPRLIKHYAGMAGIDARRVSGHSLRAGFVTSAAMAQARPDKIMSVTRHTSIDMVMKYTRDANLFDSHAGEGFL